MSGSYPTTALWLRTNAGLLLSSQDRLTQPANSLLIDAGANVGGYAGDITRTYLGPRCYSQEAADLFTDLLSQIRGHQDDLIAQVSRMRVTLSFKAPCTAR